MAVAIAACNPLTAYAAFDASLRIDADSAATAETEADGAGAIAIGAAARAGAPGAVAVGLDAASAAAGSIALGATASASGTRAVAIGDGAGAEGIASSAIGVGARATGRDASAFGAASGADGKESTALGSFAYAAGEGSVALGLGATTGDDDAVAIGRHAAAYTNGSIAIGSGTAVFNDKSVAIGYESVADSDLSTRAYAPGANVHAIAAAVPFAEVSVGYPGEERRITHVAAGAADTDAVNISQLKAVDRRVQENRTALDDLQGRITGIDHRIDRLDGTVATAPDSGAGSETPPHVATDPEPHPEHPPAAPRERPVADRADIAPVDSSPPQPRVLTHVMAGAQDTDAVNVQQLNGVKSQVAGIRQSVDNLQSQVDRRFDQMNGRMNRLGAMNAAMSTMVASAAALRTDNSVAIGTGLYRGQAALAIGYQRKIAGRMAVTISGSTAGSAEYSVGMGAGYGW
ncbi:YadA-like family protein [Burkholderia guangdongensis]|uniref:YadA-like family protein n=1 Tax=Burkholderia guangdongensis TaxID=1792500 RepID=UPI0015CE1938